MKTPNMNPPEKQNRSWRHLCARWGVGLVVAMLFGSMASAQVLPPGSVHYGKTYGQWSEAWWQWAFSLPAGHHPLFETTDASAGQSGPVWFLGGNFTGTPVNRSIVMPSGTALFFPILNTEQDNADCNGNGRFSDGLTEAALRANLKNIMDSGHDLSCTIDGVPVAGLGSSTNAYRVPSPTPGGFSYTLPGVDNLPGNWGYTCWGDPSGAPVTVEASSYHPVADGVYLLLEPLSVGSHTIHIAGMSGTSPQDVIYNITVVDANTGYTRIYPPGGGAVNGKTYAQWSAAWWQWAFSMETIHHPLLETADTSAGQAGPVWFLGGTFVTSTSSNGITVGVARRNCTIPAGKALFFPILDWENDNGGCPPTHFTEQELRDYIRDLQDGATNMVCTIDGVPVAGLSNPTNTPYRVQSPAFDFVQPPNNNLYLSWGADCYKDTSSSPTPFTNHNAVADGVFLLLQPLSAGPHTIHFAGAFGSPATFSVDITYNITVVDSNLGNPGIAAPESTPYGKTYGQWAVEHWKWLYTMPVTRHPLFDTASVSEGQSGDVWFLGGTFTSTTSNGVVVGTAVRNVTLPEGKALFFPVIDVESATVEGNGTQIAQLSAASQFFVDHANSLSCVIDGQPARNLDHYRTQSPLFTWGPLPANNTFGDAANYPAGLTSPSVADGYWLMLNPLTPGSHTIHFTGGLTLSTAKGDPFDFDFRLDITYNLTVVPPSGVLPANSTFAGKNYTDWSIAWWQWAMGLPVTSLAGAVHPFIDSPRFDITEGQSGPVWFLAAPGGVNSRTSRIPEGKALNFALATSEWSDLEGFPTEASQRTEASVWGDHAINPFCVIDGKAVTGLGSYRVGSPQFSFTAPSPWIFGDVGGTGMTVADGLHILLAPLPAGRHTIHYGSQVHFAVAAGDAFDYDGFYDQTYVLDVIPAALKMARKGTDVVLSWPQTGASYVLETKDSLTSGDWSAAGAAITPLEEIYQVTIPASSGSQFFRLRKQ